MRSCPAPSGGWVRGPSEAEPRGPQAAGSRPRGSHAIPQAARPLAAVPREFPRRSPEPETQAAPRVAEPLRWSPPLAAPASRPHKPHIVVILRGPCLAVGSTAGVGDGQHCRRGPASRSSEPLEAAGSPSRGRAVPREHGHKEHMGVADSSVELLGCAVYLPGSVSLATMACSVDQFCTMGECSSDEEFVAFSGLQYIS